MIALIDYGAGNVRSVHKALEAVGADVRLARDPGPIPDADKLVLPGVGAFGDCMAGLHRAGLVDALIQAVAQGKPLLGICVGMQVLFDEGEEMGRHAGLGLLPGRVIRFSFSSPPPCLREGLGEGSGPPPRLREGLGEASGPPPCFREGLGEGSPPPPCLRDGADCERSEAEGSGSPLKIPHTGWNQIEPTLPSPLLHDLPPGAWAYFNHAYFCQASPAHVLAVTDYGGPFPSVVGLGHITGIQFHPEKSQHVGLHILRNFAERVR
jgi:glutamine amidotransferase